MATSKIQKLSVGSLLWSGNWTSGSITVPNTSNYRIFLVIQGGQVVQCIRRFTGLYIDGSAIIGATNGSQFIKSFSASINGNTWTYRWANEITHTPSSNHSTATTGQAITEIYGLL